MHKQLSLLMFLIGTFSCAAFQIEERHLQKSSELEEAQLFYENHNFYVIHNTIKTRIKLHDTDAELRAISKKKLKAFLKCGYLRLKQFDNGEYKVYANVRGVGGGPIGAGVGVFIGKFGTYAVCHGAITVVAGAVGMVNPAAGATVGYALEATLKPIIETASTKVALTCGIVLGSASPI